MNVIEDANFRGVKRRYANFSGFRFKGIANFMSVILEYANFSYASFKGGVNFTNAILNGTDFRWAKLKDATFWKAELNGVNFTGAELNGVDFMRAELKRANLLSAKNLTIEQLSQAKTLYEAKLDPKLLEQVKRKCPKLLREFGDKK